MLGQALQQTFGDLASAIGYIALGVIAYFVMTAILTRAVYEFRGGDRAYEEREAKDLPKELAAFEAQRREAVRCIGGGRRGPERICGPESRERLPFSGRRSA